MTAEKKVGLFFVVGLGILLVLTMTVEDLSLPFFRNEYQLTAYFKSIGDLRVGNTVTVSGMPVGRIKSFQLAGNEIMVRFSVHEQYKIPRDSEAEIVLTTLLGGNQINISLGDSTEYFRNGDEIATSEMISIGAILNSVANTSDSLQSMIGNFDEGQQEVFERIRILLDANEGKISTIVNNFEEASENMSVSFASLNRSMDNVDVITRNFQEISENLAEGRGTIGKLLHDEEMYNNLRDITEDIRQMQAALHDQESMLGKLFYSEKTGEDFEHAVASIRGFSGDLHEITSSRGVEIEAIISNLYTSSQSFSEMTRNLSELAEKMERGEGTLGRILSDDELYLEIKSLIEELRQTVRNVEETVINNSVFSVFMTGIR